MLPSTMGYTPSHDWSASISVQTWNLPDDDQRVADGAADIRKSINQVADTFKNYGVQFSAAAGASGTVDLKNSHLVLHRAAYADPLDAAGPAEVLRKDEVRKLIASDAPAHRADGWIGEDLNNFASLRAMVKAIGQAAVTRVRYRVTRTGGDVGEPHFFMFGTPWQPGYTANGMLMCYFNAKTNSVASVASYYGKAWMNGANVWVGAYMNGWGKGNTCEWNMVYYDPVYAGNTVQMGHNYA